MTKRYFAGLPAALSMLCVFFCSASAIASVRLVPQQYPTIQAAINASSTGDEIIVAPGSYFENINTMGKGVILTGLENTFLFPVFNQPVIVVSASTPAPTIRGFSIQEGSAPIGGAIMVNSNAGLVLEDSILVNNHAGGGGAMFVGQGATVIIRGCQFRNNSADGDGGAILMLQGSDVDVAATTFALNTAGNDGGAIFMTGAYIDHFALTFMNNNHAGGNGGAIAAVNDSEISMRGIIGSNSADGDGGAVYARASLVSSSGAEFFYNVATGSGGAFAVSDGSVLSSRNDLFQFNQASSGGAVAVFDSEFNALRPVFTLNNGGVFGGAVRINASNSNAIGRVYLGLIRENTAAQGGAVRVETTTGAGGATPGAGVALVGCYIADNSSFTGTGVGGVSAFENPASGAQAVLEVLNTTVTGNVGGPDNGVVGQNDPRIILRNSIVWGNQNGNLINGIARTEARYSIFPEAGLHGGTANLNQDPLLFGAGPYPGRLGLSSPAIDSGRNADVPRDFMDADSDGDTIEPVPLDISDFSRFSDDPLTPNSGAGSGAIVDRGAFEFRRTCISDFDYPFGEPNFFDISAFITAFSASSPTADLAAPFGVWNFFDVSAFIAAFNAGCP